MLFLFDVDGTLTIPRKKIENDMYLFLTEIRKIPGLQLGIVGGSDYHKILEQVTPNIADIFDYVFSENGMVLHQKGKCIHQHSLKTFFSQSTLNSFVSECLLYISQLDIPIKTGTFIEFRNGVINVSPIGRNCSQEERDEFEIYDHQHLIRKKMIEHLKNKFPDLEFDYSIGGQISFDVFKSGFNKTYCLPFIHESDEIHFFGDKTFEGGNDYEIFNDNRVNGHSVNSYHDTIKICRSILSDYQLL